MKRDHENLLSFERTTFDTFVKALEAGDKDLARMLQTGKSSETKTERVLFNQNTEQFVDMGGNVVGPFSVGERVQLDSQISSLLVASGKASYVDER